MFEYTQPLSFSVIATFCWTFFLVWSRAKQEEEKSTPKIISAHCCFLLFARASSLVCSDSYSFVCPPLLLSTTVRPSAKISSIGKENSVYFLFFLRSIFKTIQKPEKEEKIRIFGKSQHNSFFYLLAHFLLLFKSSCPLRIGIFKLLARDISASLFHGEIRRPKSLFSRSLIIIINAIRVSLAVVEWSSMDTEKESKKRK